MKSIGVAPKRFRRLVINPPIKACKAGFQPKYVVNRSPIISLRILVYLL
ncbi:MAG: hypothetical protein QW655_04565 [Nitrososphaerota archaeon]